MKKWWLFASLLVLPLPSSSCLHLASVVKANLEFCCVAFSQAAPKSMICLLNAYSYNKNRCAPPAYVSCQISDGIVAQQVGKCHCSVRRPEQSCHTLYRSLFVWLRLTGPIHHCWACWLGPQHNHRGHRYFSKG